MPDLRVPAGEGRADPIDLRVIAVFLLVTAALLAPGAWQLVTPTDRQDVDDFVSTLRSRAVEAATIIDRRDVVARPYFASQLEDLGDATDQERGILLHRPADADAASVLPPATDLAETFSEITERAALSYDDPAALQRERDRLEEVRAELERMAGG